MKCRGESASDFLPGQASIMKYYEVGAMFCHTHSIQPVGPLQRAQDRDSVSFNGYVLLLTWWRLGFWLTAKCCSTAAAAAAAPCAPQRLLRQCNAVDFNDLLDLCVKMFTAKPEILQQQQALRPFLLVDEFQDSNKPQVCGHLNHNILLCRLSFYLIIEEMCGWGCSAARWVPGQQQATGVWSYLIQNALLCDLRHTAADVLLRHFLLVGRVNRQQQAAGVAAVCACVTTDCLTA
jgi:hypothetical protein